jgi:hypothetical protein
MPRPVTVNEAVDAYEKDLIARRGSLRNAGRIRKHLTPRLAAKARGVAYLARARGVA